MGCTAGTPPPERAVERIIRLKHKRYKQENGGQREVKKLDLTLRDVVAGEATFSSEASSAPESCDSPLGSPRGSHVDVDDLDLKKGIQSWDNYEGIGERLIMLKNKTRSGTSEMLSC